MAQFEIGKKINTFYDVYDLGQHTLSKANEEKVYDLLLKDPNATIENGILTLKADVYDFYAEQAIKEGFSNFVEVSDTPEEILSKERFVDYFNENELDDILEDFAQQYAMSKTYSLVNQLDLLDVDVSESEVLTYLVDSNDIQIKVDYDVSHFYDVYLGHTDTHQPLSYAQEKAVNLYLEQNNYVEDGLVTIHHDSNNEIFSSFIDKYPLDEYLEEKLSYDDDFMSYIADCYKKQIGDPIINDLPLDKAAVYEYVTGIYDSNDNFEEAIEIITAKTLDTPYKTSEGEYLVFHGSEEAWDEYDSSKAPEDRTPTYANKDHVYFSSNQLTAGTYRKRIVIKDKPPDITLLKYIKNDEGNIYFAEADKYGNFTGRGLEPKEIFTNEFGAYATDIKNNEWITIPSFDKNNVPQLQKEGEYMIFEVKPDGKIDLDERFKYFTANYTGKPGLGINNLADHVDFIVSQHLPFRIETKGVVRPFYVKLENPFIVNANGENSVVPFTDNHGRKWGSAGLYSYQRIPPIKEIEKYAKENGYDGVILKNTVDIGAKDKGFSDKDYLGDTVIAFSPKQIRLAEDKLHLINDVKESIMIKEKTPRIISDCIASLYREQGIISNNMSDWDNNFIDGYKPSVDDLKALKRNIGGCFSNLSTDIQDLHPDFHRKLNRLFKNNFEEMQNFVEDFGNVSKAFTPSSNVKLNTELSYIIDTLKLPENEHIDRTEKVDIVRFQMEKMILDKIDQTIIKEIKRDPDKSLAAYFEKPDLKTLAAAINNGEPLKDGERLKELVDRATNYTMPKNERFTSPKDIANYLRTHSQVIPDEPGKLSALLLTANNAPITYKPIEEMSLPKIAKIANHPLCSTLVLVSNGEVPEVTIKEFESHVKKVGGVAMDTIICKKTDDELTVESLMYKKHDGPPFRFNKTERLDIKEMSTFTDAEAKIIQSYHFNQLKKTNLSKPEGLKECIYHMEQSGKFLNHQEINLISFDSKGKALNIRNLGSGTVGGTCSNPKIVFDELLKKEVSEVKVFHNHTSGASDPQTNDVLNHRELKRMGELLNKTIDSYIVSRSGVHDVETGNVYNYQKKDLIKYKQKTAKTKEKVPLPVI